MQDHADRHRALVLCGPSLVGKTSFAKQLVKPGEYIEINCCNLKTAPDLRCVTHATKLICFDEATIRWCLDFKKLLQGPEQPLTLGDSNTSMYTYRVNLNGIMMVVCTNTWLEELATQAWTEAELQYLRCNFEVVECNSVLWQQ